MLPPESLPKAGSERKQPGAGNVRERPGQGNEMALHAAAYSSLRCFTKASPAIPGPLEDRPWAFHGVTGKNFIKKPEIGVFHGEGGVETFINKKKLMIS